METVFAYTNDLFSLEVAGRVEGRGGEYLKRIGCSSFDDERALVDYSFTTAPQRFTLWNDEEKLNSEFGIRNSELGKQNSELGKQNSELGKQNSELGLRVRGRAVFFETRYFFRADFKPGLTARVIHPMAAVSDSFNFSRGTLVGTLDFINNPGKFSLQIEIRRGGAFVRMETIEFMVVSVKMDVVRDYNRILEAIQKEQRNLVFQFMSKTTLGARLADAAGAVGNDTWYRIFQGVFEFYLNACRQVVESPHLKYVARVFSRRADRVRHWTPQLANRYAAMDVDRRETEHFRVERLEGTVDTRENRFVLWTLRELSKRLAEFADELSAAGSAVSDDFVKCIRSQGVDLARMATLPFFARVGRFTGFRQESLVLQKRSGYAQIYSAWLTLRKGLEPVGSDVDAGHRPISALYEFWCFLTMRGMLEARFGKPVKNGDGAFDWAKALDCGGDDDKALVKMDVVFRDEANSRTVTLSYQKSYGTGDEAMTYAGLNSQRPDIVLSIADAGGEGGVFTYLFDAKYRIDSKDGKDGSPREAIDDMHRYRDAILYRAQRGASPSHEVIGAYVLFPGRSVPESYDYGEVIRAENIGGIPLLPGEDGEMALRDFIDEILEKKTLANHLDRAIAPRGASIRLGGESVLVVRTDNWRDAVKRGGDGMMHCIREVAKGAQLPVGADYLLVIEKSFAVALYRIESAAFSSRPAGIDFRLVDEECIEDSPVFKDSELPDGSTCAIDAVRGTLA